MKSRFLALVALLLAAGLEFAYLIFSPSVPLLPPFGEGTWLRLNKENTATIYTGNWETAGLFRKRFLVLPSQTGIDLTVTAFQEFELFLDGVALPLPTPASWKEPVSLNIPAGVLSPGEHELAVEVRSRMAPPLLRVSSKPMEVGGPAGWESSMDGIRWLPALTADAPRSLAGQEFFPTVGDGVANTFPVLLPLFLAVLAMSAAGPAWAVRLAAPESVRNVVMAVWVFLWVNNMVHLPLLGGFDGEAHMDYIRFVAENRRLPLPSEGWQMFQPPLYYVVSSFLSVVLGAFLSEGTVILCLKAVPFLSGLLLVEISHRTLRELFPDRPDLRSYGLLVAGLLPMNLYMSQWLGNEPMAAALTAIAIYLTVKAFRSPSSPTWGSMVVLGGVFGAAILTKPTPVLLVPLVVAIFLVARWDATERFAARMKRSAVFLSMVAAVSGWCFLRNFWHFGKPFVGGWDPVRGFQWWQEPGYRHIGELFAFGGTFRQPIVAALGGFADSVYSTFWADGFLSGFKDASMIPEWNHSFLAAAVLFAIVPATLLVVGVVVSLTGSGAAREEGPRRFLASSILLLLGAVLHMFVTVPTLTSGKGSYLMGLAPAFAVMVAYGAETVKIRWASIILPAFLLLWGAATVVGFFAG